MNEDVRKSRKPLTWTSRSRSGWKNIILRVYRLMKKNPDKIYVRKDLGLGVEYTKPVVDLLLALDLIEELEVVYQVGRYKKTRQGTKGYRFRRQKNE